MNHKLAFLFCLLFTMFISSCKKVKNNQVDATIYVKEYKTETPIANAKVLILRGAAGSGVGSALVETLYTDNDGKVDYNATVDEDYMYYAEAYKDKYFDTHNQQVSVTPGKKNFNTTIYMYAESYVKLHVKNVNPFNQYDLLHISTFCKVWYFQGLVVDTTIYFCDYGYSFMGNFEFYAYGCTVTKNNVDSIIHFEFIPIPHDTITVNINY